jgi:hypothetical protein
MVFAFLESADCYGSLIELGWAHAWGKPVVLRLPDDDAARNELWMAAEAARRVYRGNLISCWRRFLRDFVSVWPLDDPDILVTELALDDFANRP